LFGSLDIDRMAVALDRDGICEGIELPAAAVSEITDFAYRARCHAGNDSRLGFLYREKDAAQARYGRSFLGASYFNVAVSCDVVRRIAVDPIIREIAARSLSAEPVLQGTRLVWSFACESTPHQRFKSNQTFHYDLDDYRQIRFFFYLTDVSPSSGPHVCVAGSHRHKKLSHRLLRGYIEDEEAIRYYGAETIRTLCGRAGFGFAEDSFCLHKVSQPKDGDRLILKIGYGVRDYGMMSDERNVGAETPGAAGQQWLAPTR
jgi:hypothetical protein